MTEIRYPGPLEQRVLLQEARGGEFHRLTVAVPSVIAAGEPFTVKLAVVDKLGYPCAMGTDTTFPVCAPSGLHEGRRGVKASEAREEKGNVVSVPIVEVTFKRGQPAVAMVDGLRIDRAGLFRLTARLDGRVFHSNAARVTERPERFIYWGDPHVHTVLSDCHPERCRSLNFCFVAARWLSGLDWVTAADHVSSGRVSRGKWKGQAAGSDLFDDPPTFVTLPGYEASLDGGLGGDNNVYMLRWPETWVDVWDERGSTRDLCEKLAGLLDRSEFFIVPHHTTRTGKHGEIPESIYPGPEMMPVVEIHSKWGTSEYRGNPNPLHQIHPGPSYVADLLAAGLPLGFVGGTDTHSTMPAGFGHDAGHIDRLPGMTAVMAGQLTRRDVFGAIRRRSCYAASGERVYLDAAVGGAAMGSLVPWSDPDRPRTIDVTAGGASDIQSVEIVRDGETIVRHEPGGWQARFTYVDEDPIGELWKDSAHIGPFVYYYVRVTCASGAQAWSSPVWLTRP